MVTDIAPAGLGLHPLEFAAIGYVGRGVIPECFLPGSRYSDSSPGETPGGRGFPIEVFASWALVSHHFSAPYSRRCHLKGDYMVFD